jgi:hypothetical protein
VLGLSRSSRPRVAAAAAFATLVVLLSVSAPAQAALSAPTGLSPSSAVSTSTPTFSWSRVKGATLYQIQVTDSSSNTSSTQTANNKWVPSSNLADGPVSWQVRAMSPNGNSGWATANASVQPTAAPSPTSPVGGVHLTQPDSPALLRWSAVSGASGYEIQVDNTGTWVSPTTYSAKGTSYFVDTPQAPGSWFWRVRAVRGQGLYTQWSGSASYVVDPLADPQAGADMNTGTPMQDVRIDWLPVAGAMSYQLQVGRDPDFNNIIDNVIVDGTAFSPAVTYDNDQYYWRVRAIDAGQNRMPWTTAQPFTFQRNWPQKPTLQYPVDQLAPSVGDPLFYQWTPVRHATRYQLDVSTDQNFSPASIHTCYTTGTTFSPMEGSPNNNYPCGPQGQGVTTYWRVRAIDDPRGVLGIYSAIHKYVYDSGPVTQTAPANGATVDVPTLKWNAVRETQGYEVILRDKNGQVVADLQTRSTSWTPETLLSAASSPYSWTVQSIDASGSFSPLYAAHTFSVSGSMPTSVQPALTPLTGIATDPATSDFPSLSWVPQTGASYYRIKIGVAGSGFWDDASTSHINQTAYSYPAATDTGTPYLSPGDYRWQVQAYDSSNVNIGTGPSGQFTITQLTDAGGQRVSLDGIATQTGHACTNALSNVVVSSQICIGVPATPVLSWNPVPHAAGYLVYLANDQELTNAVVNPYAVTSNTVWRPPSDLPDNTAQDSYYWYVRPCKSIQPLVGCTADPASTNAVATNAFRKQSPGVVLQTPADGATVTSDPTFTWTDYYDTNQAISYVGGADHAYQTARSYHLQISQSPTFNTLVDERSELDQPYYTPNDRTLPQGTLYWRVQVIDPTTNHLTWSAVRSFSNAQPAIDLVNGADTAPAIGATVGGAPAFSWTPMDGASAYQIEVYRNNDTTHSDANRMLSVITKVSAFVPQNYLPTSSSDYRWRVRWFDADGQPRPWSSDGQFAVHASTVTLNTPANGTYQPNTGIYFSWNPAPLAASYYLEARDANGNVVYQRTTSAIADAPSVFNDGQYDWRVQALDPNGNPIATSQTRTFTVDSQAPVVKAYSPLSSGKPKSKVKVTFTEPVIGLSTSTFFLKVKGRTTRLPVKLTVASSHRSATLAPKSNLKRGKSYTVTITKTVHDGAGNHLKKFTWTFKV